MGYQRWTDRELLEMERRRAAGATLKQCALRGRSVERTRQILAKLARTRQLVAAMERSALAAPLFDLGIVAVSCEHGHGYVYLRVPPVGPVAPVRPTGHAHSLYVSTAGYEVRPWLLSGTGIVADIPAPS